MGPTTKLPSLGHIGFEAMAAAYEEQAAALIEGGVDLLLIETCQDLLQAKIATIGVLDAMRKSWQAAAGGGASYAARNRNDVAGHGIGAALTALEPFDVDILGLNCATGPKEMNDAVRYLALNSTKEISILPNAGLPHNEGGHAVYKLTPDELAEYHKHFVVDYACGLWRFLRNNSGPFESRGRRGFRSRPAKREAQTRGRGLERLHLRST